MRTSLFQLLLLYASHAQILVDHTSQIAVLSLFLSEYFSFFRIIHRFLVKSQIPRIPFQSLGKAITDHGGGGGGGWWIVV